MARERIWLDVPYHQKDYASRAGARWDPDARRWYAPRPGMRGLQRWAPPAARPSAKRPAPVPQPRPEPAAVPPTAARRTGSSTRSGKAGASAAAQAARIGRQEMPLVVLAAALGGTTGALLGGYAAGWIGGLAAALAGAVIGGVVVYRRGDAARWRMGAAGERRTGRRLDPLARQGWTVLHDRALPRSRANVDHLLIAPNGTVYNVDSKVRRGAVRYDPRRRFLRIGGSSGYQLVKSTVYESGRIAEELQRALGRPVPVVSVLAVHRARLPIWHDIEIKGVRVLEARDVYGWLRKRGGASTAAGAEVAAAAERAFPAYRQR